MKKQANRKFLDDLAKITGGALSSLGDFKDEIENYVSAKIEGYLTKMNFVKREEFTVVQEMLAKTRTEQEKLTKQVKKIEAELKQHKTHD